MVPTTFIPGRCLLSSGNFFPILAIDFWVKGSVMLEHSINDPQNFMHADSYSSHLAHSILDMLRVNATNKRVALGSTECHHK